jgi:hypothetical protein
MDPIEPGEGATVHPGPSLNVLAIAFVVLALAGIAAIALPTGGQLVPSPLEPAGGTTGFFVSYRAAMRTAAFFQLGSAIVLGLFAATVTSRLTFLGVHAAGVQIAFVGGALASLFRAIAGLTGWILGQEGDLSIDLLHALHLQMFAAGVVGQVACLGLHVAGVSLAGGLTRLLPRWFMAVGVAIAAVAEISTVGLVFPAALHLTRAAGLFTFAWMVTLGVLLPRSRAPRLEAAPGSSSKHLRPVSQT